mgnify:CR=1 FL=1
MGLLDNMDTPEMAFSMGLLGSGGPSMRPVSLGQGLASAYGNAMQAKDRQAQNRMRELQFSEAQQGMADRTRLRQDEEQLRSILPELMKSDDPQEILKNMLASGNPGAIQMAGKLAPVLAAMQKDTKTTWQDAGDRMIQIDASGQPTGATMPKGAAPQGPEKLPWYVQKGQDGRPAGIDPLYSNFERMKAANMRPPAQPMAPVAYIDGSGKTVWGTITDARGKPAANYNPFIQGDIARAKASGKEYGESGAKSAISLPQSLQEAENTITLVDDLLKHPGFKQAVGGSSLMQVQRIPGTDAKDFMNRLDQLKGKQFLQAFESLKGAGQITEVEGVKATQAISRMDNATSEGGFVQASREFQNIIRQGVKRAKQKAAMGGGFQPDSQPAASVDSLLEKYK